MHTISRIICLVINAFTRRKNERRQRHTCCPQNVRIHLAEPAIVMQVKMSFFQMNPKHLFLKPPLFPKSHYLQALKDLSNAEIIESQPGQKIRLKKAFTPSGEDTLFSWRFILKFLDEHKNFSKRI